MDETVENRVGEGRVTDGIMPLVDGKLAGHDRGAHGVAVLETATNVLAFGLPGVGKSHGLCAVGHALVEAGRSVLCVPAYALVQELLGAKRDLDLLRALRKLDLFEVILLD